MSDTTRSDAADHARFAPRDPHATAEPVVDARPPADPTGAARIPPDTPAPRAAPPRRTRTLLVGGAAAVVIGAAVAGGLWMRARTAPRRALEEVAAAVRAHDLPRIERHVDLTALAKQLVEEGVTAVQVEALRSSNSTATQSDPARVVAVSATVARSLEMSLRTSLVNPNDSTAAANMPAMLDPLYPFGQALGAAVPVTDASTPATTAATQRLSPPAPRGGSVEWQGFGTTVVLGDTALVPFTARDRELSKATTLTARLVRRNGAWVVIGIHKVGDVLTEIRAQRTAIIDRYNVVLGDTLKSLMSIGPARVRVSNPDGWGINVYVIVSAPVTNRSSMPLRWLGIGYRQDDGSRLENVYLTPMVGRAKVPLQPGETAVYDYYLEYNRFIDWHRTVRYTSYKAAQFEPRFAIRGTAEKPDTLVSLDTWDEYLERIHRRD